MDATNRNSRISVPRIFADVDTGIDDSLALIYLAALHQAGEICLVGVSCSAGNTTSAQATRNSKWILNLCGAGDVPVVCGLPHPAEAPLTTTPETHGPQGLGYNVVPPQPQYIEKTSNYRPAVVDAWNRAPENTHLLVTGPLTAFSYVKHNFPQVLSRFVDVTIMGGALNYPGNTTPYSEWNFWVDPEAVDETFNYGSHPIAATLCPLNVTETITITSTDVQRWAKLGMPAQLLRVVRRATQFYFEFHQSVGEGYLAQIHDLFVAMVAIGAVHVETSQMGIRSVEKQKREVDPSRRGQVTEHRLGASTTVVTATDRDAVMAEFDRAVRLLALQQ